MGGDGRFWSLNKDTPLWVFFAAGLVLSAGRRKSPAHDMGRGLLLWLLGVPIPINILLWIFFR
jgi:hypothetical protein